MKNVFLFLLTISTLKVAGQNHFIGAKSGANSTNITSRNFLSQNNSSASLMTDDQ